MKVILKCCSHASFNLGLNCIAMLAVLKEQRDVSVTPQCDVIDSMTCYVTHLSNFFQDDCKDPEVENEFHDTQSPESLGRVKAREVHRDDVTIQQDERYVRHLQLYHQIKSYNISNFRGINIHHF